MIQGERIRLRAMEREDIPRCLKWLNDPGVTRYLTLYLPFSQDAEEEWFERHLRDERSRVFAIETAEGRHIGNIGLDDINWKDRHAKLGIFIGERDFWGRGYGTDAVRTVLRLAFQEMGLHRISLHVFEFNQRAKRCYEKCGFREEGCLREAHFTDGRYHDVLLMGILAREFSASGESSEEGGGR